MPAITILLPVYNGANYLAESIASVLAQDFEDFELHVLDDGSDDKSPEIAQGTGDGRVRYSRNPGRFGLYKTLNRGFGEAQTSLVRLWAHDDRMLPGSLRRFVEFAERHPSAGMIYCDFHAIDAQGNRTGAEQAFVDQRVRTPEVASPLLSALLFWCYGCLPGNVSTVLLRREVWDELGGFRSGKQQAPDYEMWVRVSENHDVGFIQEKLIELRDHPFQLGRLGQKQMTTIEEELVVVKELQRRLSDVLSPTELRNSWLTGRGVQHAHWIARAMARRDVSAAARGLRALASYGYPLRQFAVWLATGNGRWLIRPRAELFDRHAAQCSRE